MTTTQPTDEHAEIAREVRLSAEFKVSDKLGNYWERLDGVIAQALIVAKAKGAAEERERCVDRFFGEAAFQGISQATATAIAAAIRGNGNG